MGHEQVVPRATAHPDPVRAHGAWVFLFASVAAGAFVGAGRWVEPAMLVGTGFAGAFLAVAAISVGLRRKRRQLLMGTSLAVICPLCALGLGANPAFLAVAVSALLPAVAAVMLSKWLGFLSRPAVAAGTAALTWAAPIVAVAGDASPVQGAILFGLLWPFFCWRALAVAAPLAAGARWDPETLRSRGLREAGITGAWTLLVVVGLLIVSRG